MADSEKQGRVRTLETPMMAEHVHVPTIPPSRVGVAAPEARNYVHSTPSPAQEDPPSRAPWIALGAALMLALVMAVMGLLAATNHVVFK